MQTKKKQKTSSEPVFKMAISDFPKKHFLPPKKSKKNFFGKFSTKSRIFKIFKKTGIYVEEL